MAPRGGYSKVLHFWQDSCEFLFTVRVVQLSELTESMDPDDLECDKMYELLN
jgi:hypothetical protein